MKLGIRVTLFGVVLLCVLAASYFFGFKQRDARRHAREAAIDAKVKALDDLGHSTAGVRDVQKKIDELQQATAFFEGKLPKAKKIDRILKQVWHLAETNGLQTKTVKTLTSKRMNGYSEQPIEMTLSGNFNGFYEYLLQLEKLPRLTRVTQMNLSKITSRDGEMQAQLTLSIFFEPDMDAGDGGDGVDPEVATNRPGGPARGPARYRAGTGVAAPSADEADGE